MVLETYFGQTENINIPAKHNLSYSFKYTLTYQSNRGLKKNHAGHDLTSKFRRFKPQKKPVGDK